MTQSHHRYNLPAQVFHWGMAALILGMLALGLYVQQLPFSPEKLKLISWHKWGGIVALILVILRLLWRWARPTPAPLPSIAAWQQRIASLTHGALYLLMVLVPMSGWLMSSAKGVPTVLFGVWPLPDLIGRDAELGNTLANVHWSLNVALMVLIGLHILAALKHHFVDRDETLRRMTPGRTKSPQTSQT